MAEPGTAIILGTGVEGADKMNIGDAIHTSLVMRGWRASGNNCLDADGEYRIPTGLKYGNADALVVSLGYTASVPWREGIEEEEIAEVIRACLTLPLMAAKVYVEERGDEGGKVVFIGSYAHDHVLSDSVAYCAAKAGLAQATRALAWDLTPHGFSFYIVHPYHVPDTPMGQLVVGNMMVYRDMTMEEAQEYQAKDLRLDRHLTSMDVAEAVCWLLAPLGYDMTPWLSGQSINLYGGVR